MTAPRAAGDGCGCDPRIVGDRSCPAYFEHLAAHQADRLQTAHDRIRRLIAERDAENAAKEAAWELAAQYAKALGRTLDHDQVSRHAEEYWRMREQFDRTWDELERFRHDMLGLAYDIETRLDHAGLDAVGGAEVARRIVAAINDLNPVGGPRRDPGALFPRTALPAAQPALFGQESAA